MILEAILLANLMTCLEAKDIIQRVRANELLNPQIQEEIVVELLQYVPGDCKDLQTELSR